jgi:putative aldouronate transport system substrate-binding protein
MKRRLLFAVLALLCAATLFATGAQEDVSGQAEARYPDDVDPFGAYDPGITVRIAKETNAAVDHPEGWSYSENVWYDAIEDKLGITLINQFEALGGEEYATKMNLAIASNDLPDILTLPKYSMYQRLLRANKLEVMTEAYEKFAYPRFREYYEDDGGVKKSWGTEGDEIYGFARGGLNYQSPRMVYIRADWREELGLPRPQTMNDVLDIGRAFYEVDPENRYALLVNNEILESGFCDMIGIANSMGVYPRKWIVGDDGKITYGTIQPGMKDVLSVYRDLYEQGMLDPEFAVKDGGVTAPTLLNGKTGVVVGMFWVASWPLPSLWETEQVDWEVYPIMPMEGYGDEVKVQLANVERAMYAVRNGYEYPEAFVKIMNFQIAKLNDPERAETEKFHSNEGETYHSYQPFYSAYGPSWGNLDTQIHVTQAIDNGFDESYLVTPHDHNQYGPVKGWFEAQEAGEVPKPVQWARYRFWYGDHSTFGVINKYRFNDQFLISPVEGVVTEEMGRRLGALHKVEDEYMLQIITGVRPLDDFDEMAEKWLSLGGRTILDQLNEIYESQ